VEKKARRTRRTQRTRRKAWNTLRKKREVRNALWILGVPTSFAQQKGLTSEERALRSFEYFQRRRKKFGLLGEIKKITPTMHYSKEDRRGIDIKVEFQNEILFAEVKNQGSQKLEEELWEKNRCLIVMPWNTSDEKARDIIWKAVNRFFRERAKKSSTDQFLGAYH